jgi:hypothetical protein
VKEVRGAVREGFSEALRPQRKGGSRTVISRVEGLSFYVNYVQGNSMKLGLNSTYG